MVSFLFKYLPVRPSHWLVGVLCGCGALGSAALGQSGAPAAPPQKSSHPNEGATSDDAILAFIGYRQTLAARVTEKPLPMDPAAATLCNAPSLDQPDHGRFYSHVYISPDQAGALFDPWGRCAEGTIIIKEKWASSSPDEGTKPDLFTGMIKRQRGFAPEVGDWEFFIAYGDGRKITHRGPSLTHCIDCHQKYPDRDFVTKAYTAGSKRPAAVAQTSRGEVYLHGVSAQLKGEKLQYEPQAYKNTVGFWTMPGDTAHWDFTVTQPGEFAVEILQGAGKGCGGAEVEVVFDQQAPIKLTVQETGHFQHFITRVIGKTTLTAGTHRVSFIPQKKKGVAVMDLRRVVLRPLSPP